MCDDNEHGSWVELDPDTYICLALWSGEFQQRGDSALALSAIISANRGTFHGDC